MCACLFNSDSYWILWAQSGVLHSIFARINRLFKNFESCVMLSLIFSNLRALRVVSRDCWNKDLTRLLAIYNELIDTTHTTVCTVNVLKYITVLMDGKLSRIDYPIQFLGIYFWHTYVVPSSGSRSSYTKIVPTFRLRKRWIEKAECNPNFELVLLVRSNLSEKQKWIRILFNLAHAHSTRQI